MGRAAKYTEADILDAALGIVAEDGVHAVTVVAIAHRLGAPSGSIYHRFASRDLILAKLWIRTVRRFQEGYLAALNHPEPIRAARAAAAHTVNWTADHRSEARLLVLYRREDLIALWPEELGDELATLNDKVQRAVLSCARACFGAVDEQSAGRVRFALIDLPYAAARQVLATDGPMAPWLESALLAAVSAILRVGGEDS